MIWSSQTYWQIIFTELEKKFLSINCMIFELRIQRNSFHSWMSQKSSIIRIWKPKCKLQKPVQCTRRWKTFTAIFRLFFFLATKKRLMSNLGKIWFGLWECLIYFLRFCIFICLLKDGIHFEWWRGGNSSIS